MIDSGLNLEDTVHACSLILSNPGKWGADMVEGARAMLRACQLDLSRPDDDCTTHEEIRTRQRLRLRVDVLLGVPGASKAAARIAKQERRHFWKFLRHGMWHPEYRSKG